MRHVTLIAILASALARLALACTSGDGTCGAGAGEALTADGGGDAGAAHDAAIHADATTHGDATAPAPRADSGLDAAAATAAVRLANWSADSPAVDFCLASHGTADFEGPFTLSLAETIAAAQMIEAGAGGVPFPAVTAYVSVPPGQYDVKIVAAGANSCSVAIGPPTTNLAPISAGDSVTIALVGAAQPQTTQVSSQPGLRLVEFFDDTMATTNATVSARFINASPDIPSADLGFNGAYTAPVSNIPFGKASLGPSYPTPDGSAPDGAPLEAQAPPPLPVTGTGASLIADPNGYALEPLPPNTTLTVRQSNPPLVALTATGVNSTPGIPLTFVLLGVDATAAAVAADAAAPTAQLLECVDNAGVAGAYSSCCLFSGGSCVSVPR